MTDQRPNLFRFATSELSQDAMLCWLLSWAEAGFAATDEPLHLAGREFLDAILRRAGIEPPASIRSVCIDRQFEKLDVLALVNDDIAVLIEDKTHTKQHSGQLARYREAVRAKYPQRALAAVYYKTGDQGCYKAVEEAGFVRFSRQDILGVLRRGREHGVGSDIFRDYLDHLERLEGAVQAFRSARPEEWTAHAWAGFFIELQDIMKGGDWKRVNNEAGGFMGFWWHGTADKYLLLREAEVCFKVNLAEPDKGRRRAAWIEWHAALTAEARHRGRALTREKRALGKDMTVACMPGDYRRWDGAGRLDLERTVERLREAESLHDAALARQPA